MFQSIIESRLEEHRNTDEHGKNVIEFDIIRHVICVKRGRFLKYDNDKGWWSNMLIDDDDYGDYYAGQYCEQKAAAALGLPIRTHQEKEADIAPIPFACAGSAAKKKQLQEVRLKVHYAFRDFVKKQKTQQNLQVLRSSTYLFEQQQHEMHYSKRTRRGSVDGGDGSSDDNSNCANKGCSAWAL